MPTTKPLTNYEKILLVAAGLDQKDECFSAEALVVACWESDKQTFGLRGYEQQYPDSNRILSYLMGKLRLVDRGWLDRAGPKLYCIGTEGRQVIRRLLGSEEEKEDNVPKAKQISMKLKTWLHKVLESRAMRKYEEPTQVAEINFMDACCFWGIDTSKQKVDCPKQLVEAQNNLELLGKSINGDGCTLPNGRWATSTDVAKVGELHNYLANRYRRHLGMLQHRATKQSVSSKGSV